jgi:NitT/TauT family transport system ATP-binding protein
MEKLLASWHRGAKAAGELTGTDVLEVTELTRTYGHGDAAHVAIEGVNLSVADGELVSIVGPSGCGKSTLLRCIAGLLKPTAGRVVLSGTPVDHVPDRLSVVFQDYSRSLYPWLSVQDNVALPLRKTERSRKARRAAAGASLAAIGLPDVAGKYPWQLSGGMQQRVAIARALSCDPELLLMDEPFGSVDAQTREDLEDLVLRVRRERGITILIVTHDIDESVYVGDRVIVLSPGPGRVRADLATNLPEPRDQITTKELPEFVHLRAEVSRLVRSRADSGEGAESGPPVPHRGSHFGRAGYGRKARLAPSALACPGLAAGPGRAIRQIEPDISERPAGVAPGRRGGRYGHPDLPQLRRQGATGGPDLLPVRRQPAACGVR